MAEKSGGSVNWKCPNPGCGYVLPGEMSAMRFCPKCKLEVKTQTPVDTGRPSSRELRNLAHASPRVAGDEGREPLGDIRDNVDSPSTLPSLLPGQADAEAKTKQAGDPVPCGSQTSTYETTPNSSQTALQLLPPRRNPDEATHSDISTSANGTGAKYESPSGKASVQPTTYEIPLEETGGSKVDSENEHNLNAKNGKEEDKCHGTETLKQDKSVKKTPAELRESARRQREEQRKMEVKLREEQKNKTEKRKAEQRQREIELREQHKRQKAQQISQMTHVPTETGPLQQQLATRGRGEGEAIVVGATISNSDSRKGGEAGGGDRQGSEGLGIGQSKPAGGKHPGKGDNGGGGGGSTTTGSSVQKTVSSQHT